DVDPNQWVGATEAGQPKRDQADGALAVDGHRFADRDLRPLDRVEGHVPKDRECCRGIVDVVRYGQQTVLGGLCALASWRCLGHKPVTRVWSIAQDAVARREARDLGANRLDHAYGGVAEREVGDLTKGSTRAP